MALATSDPWHRSDWLRIWAGLLGLIAAAFACAPAAAQTIENIAFARWSEAGTELVVASNRVTVTRAQAAARFETFRIAPDGTSSLTLIPSRCAPGEPGAPGTAQTLAIAPTSQYRPGEVILFTLAAPFANQDPDAVDSLAITISSSSGESADLTIFETGADTGLFAGSIATRRTTAGQPADACTLAVASGETVTLASTQAMPGGVSVTRETLILADPFGVVFDSETGAPVSGARVTMRDAVSGALAQVFAEDGVTR